MAGTPPDGPAMPEGRERAMAGTRPDGHPGPAGAGRLRRVRPPVTGTFGLKRRRHGRMAVSRGARWPTSSVCSPGQAATTIHVGRCIVDSKLGTELAEDFDDRELVAVLGEN
jgi:hypothetical protein